MYMIQFMLLCQAVKKKNWFKLIQLIELHVISYSKIKSSSKMFMCVLMTT